MAIYDLNGNVLTETDTIADYLVTETNATFSSVVEACKDKAYLFTVITDSHNERNDVAKKAWADAVSAMRYINRRYKSDAIIHLGDIIHGVVSASDAKTRLLDSVDDLLDICPKVFLCRGNHESDFAYDENHYELISTDELYSTIARQNEEFVIRNGNKLCYYVDFGSELRCVFLDSDMIGFASGQTTADLRQNYDGSRYGYDSDQITWFSEVALNTDRQVAVFSHLPATRGYISESEYWTDENRESFDNIRAAGKSFIDNGGVIVGWFYGHVHKFDQHKHSQAGFTEIALRNSFYSEEETGGVHNIPNFSILAIKPDKRRVDIISFGQDSDVNFTY